MDSFVLSDLLNAGLHVEGSSVEARPSIECIVIDASPDVDDSLLRIGRFVAFNVVDNEDASSEICPIVALMELDANRCVGDSAAGADSLIDSKAVETNTKVRDGPVEGETIAESNVRKLDLNSKSPIEVEYCIDSSNVVDADLEADGSCVEVALVDFDMLGASPGVVNASSEVLPSIAFETLDGLKAVFNVLDARRNIGDASGAMYLLIDVDVERHTEGSSVDVDSTAKSNLVYANINEEYASIKVEPCVDLNMVDDGEAVKDAALVVADTLLR